MRQLGFEPSQVHDHGHWWWSAARLIHYSCLNPNHYLRSMLSKSMRCTRNSSACSQHRSTWLLVTQSRLTLWDPLGPTRFLCPWKSLGKNSGVGCHWSTEGAQLFSMTMLNHTSHNQRFRSWKSWAMKFCLILHIHLNSCQSTITSSSISATFCRENVSTTRRQRMLSKSSSNPKAWSFKLQE